MTRTKSYTDIISYSRCTCGAVTLNCTDGSSYSVSAQNKSKYLPGLDLRRVPKLQDTYCCDHCVNGYGLDLCACGSKQPPEACDNGFEMCGQPMQVFGKYTHVSADDALLPEPLQDDHVEENPGDMLRDIIALEQQLQHALDSIKNRIYAQVAAQPFAGQRISAAPSVFILRRSGLERTNLSAEYYDPCAQEQAVKHVLENKRTPTELRAAVENMISTGNVRMSAMSGDRIYLNERTMRILQDTGLAEAEPAAV